MVSAISRIWCRSSRGGSLLTTLWKLWLVHQVRWKLFSVSEMALIQHCLTLLMLARRLSEWWWPTEGLTWSEPKRASPESGGDLQGGAPPAARGEQQRGWAVPVVAPQCGRGESQGAAAHQVPHCREDEEWAHYEVVTELSVAVGDQQTGYCCIILHWTIEPSKYRRLSLLTEVFTCANNNFWLFMVRTSFTVLMFFNRTANAVWLPVIGNGTPRITSKIHVGKKAALYEQKWQRQVRAFLVYLSCSILYSMYTEWKIKRLFNHVWMSSLLHLKCAKNVWNYLITLTLMWGHKHRCKAAVYHHAPHLTEAL